MPDALNPPPNSDGSDPAVMYALYSATAGPKIKMDYLLNNHMPLLEKVWGPYGLKSWVMDNLDPASGYSLQFVLFWESFDCFAKANSPEVSKPIFDDVPNYSDESPIRWLAKLEAQHKLSDSD